MNITKLVSEDGIRKITYKFQLSHNNYLIRWYLKDKLLFEMEIYLRCADNNIFVEEYKNETWYKESINFIKLGISSDKSFYDFLIGLYTNPRVGRISFYPNVY